MGTGGAKTLSCRPTYSSAARPSKRLAVTVHASEGVQDLLSRDRKETKLAADLFQDDTPKDLVRDQSGSEASSQPSTSGSEGTTKATARGPKSRRQRMQRIAQAADATGGDTPKAKDSGPRRCKEAIDQGLACFGSKQYQEAIDLFNLALELPGNGAYRLPGSPREYSCPSDAEENAALYNLACCYAQLGQRTAALTCLEAVLENGFDDATTIRSDPDLQPVQGSELEGLLNKYTGVGGMIGKLFSQKEKVIESDDNKNKPWILW